MPKKKHFPSKSELLKYIEENPDKVGKREIAKAFSIKGDDRIVLKQLLKELSDEGHLVKKRKKRPLKIANQINEGVSSLIVGVFRQKRGGGVVEPADNKIPFCFKISPVDAAKFNNDDLLVVEPDASNPYSGFAKVVDSYGNYLSTKALPIIEIIKQDIPFIFSDKVKNEAKEIKPASMKNRIDMRDIPLVTIDGETAKDFDDAVFAEPDKSSKNKGGWHLIVAISDVASYIHSQTALDYEARERGNSVYFPQGVVPMLPKEVSNDLGSLKQGEDRPCIAVHIWIDKEGNKLKHKFERVMINSAARLTYVEVQDILDGKTKPSQKLQNIINPLYGAYLSLAKARDKRETLDFDIPEKEAVINAEDVIVAIEPEERFESNKLIEEFMILANVCAAEELEKFEYPIMYRIHEIPTPEKRQHLFDFLKTIGVPLPMGKSFVAEYYNQILASVRDNPLENIVKQMVLRCQSQAKYAPENVGHFGLALSHYVHFTSPIRRYADLMVHRALISALGFGEDGLSKKDILKFEETAEHISLTERKAMTIERQTMDRFVAVYMRDKIENTFVGTVTGVTTAGLFVTLEESGADGLVPMRSLPGGRYEFDEKAQCLRGDRIYRLGDEIDIVLKEAEPLTGHLLFSCVETDYEPVKKIVKKPQNKIPRKGKRRK
ncbi:MAG: ribonuclease R family protein [Alphaproteobacteria bacterium]